MAVSGIYLKTEVRALFYALLPTSLSHNRDRPHGERKSAAFPHLQIFHPVVPAAVFALVMDIVAVDRPITGHLMAAAQAAEIGIILIRGHHARAMTLGAFHLDAGGQGVVGTCM